MARAITSFAAASIAAIAVAATPSFLPQQSETATAQVAPFVPEVDTKAVEVRRLADAAEFLGRTEAREAVELRSQVSGYVDEVHFEDGQLVTRGDLLFRIDPRSFKVALARAEAHVASLQAELAAAEAAFDRASKLVKRSVASREQLDQAQARRDSLKSQSDAAKAALEAAKLDLSYTEIRAPISGRIGRANVTRGNYVNTGAMSPTPLASIVSVDPIHVAFNVDEASYLKFLAGAQSQRDTSPLGLTVAVGLTGEVGFPHEGKVDFVDNRVDANSGTIRVRAILPNPFGKLAPGLFARVKLSFGQPEDKVVVDESAVGTSQDQRFVLVVDHKNTLQFRPVELGDALGDGKRVVTAGLRPGEVIMIKGMARPGMQVTPVPVATASVQAKGWSEKRAD